MPPTMTMGPMSGVITLPCWIIESHTKQIFLVEIGRDKMWGSVKDAIKEKKKPEFDDIAADTLDLWKVRQCVIRDMDLILIMPNSQDHHRSFPTSSSLNIKRLLEEHHRHRHKARPHKFSINGIQGPTSSRST
jgi:hypothetical protein